MELGLYTFVENTPLPGGEKLSTRQRLANMMEEAELADQAGLSMYAIGEHHREEYLASSPSTLLAAIAARTKNIRLSSAVTVLGSEDPVRVYQQFATIDQLSGGRAEIIAGRGSFTESFPLFGQDLSDYDAIFAEKLQLLMALRERTVIDWKGKHRPSIDGRGVYPQPLQDEIPLWIAVGGTPQSAYRTGYLGLPMAIAIIGGYPEQFKGMADLHRLGTEEGGHPPQRLSINSHGFIADTSQEAADIALPAFKITMDKIGQERGWGPMSRAQFDASTTLRGANAVGSPQQIIDKILFQHEIFGHDRFLLQMSVGSVPHKKMMRSIELFATEVRPAVEKALGVTA
ncbi:MAG: LLM class flavin-dependent oxidoreductase [Bacteroidetes bacterium]|nr:LLM class flavin-dependent oxidoreductase [Bacteroidota bacterium]MCH8525202.1 LLM class flavin-dependent oxidoreductase [Balneolales bacterium]